MPRRLWSLLLLAVLVATPALVAQQPTIGVFSRIYMGGTAPSNPQIRWGSGAPPTPTPPPPPQCPATPPLMSWDGARPVRRRLASPGRRRGAETMLSGGGVADVRLKLLLAFPTRLGITTAANDF